MIDLMLAALELLHHGKKIVLDGAADAAVGKIVDFGAALLAGASQQSAIHGDFAELIHEHGAPTVGIFFQQTTNQGGLPGAEESGNNRDRNFHLPDFSIRLIMKSLTLGTRLIASPA